MVLEGKQHFPFARASEDGDELPAVNDEPDWVEVLPRLDSDQDALHHLVSFGHSHCRNVSMGPDTMQMTLSQDLRDTKRKDCRYLRVKLIYQEEKSQFDKPVRATVSGGRGRGYRGRGRGGTVISERKKKCFIINRIELLGVRPVEPSQVKKSILAMQRQSSVQHFKDFFEEIKDDTIYEKISQDQRLFKTFTSSIDEILPKMATNPAAFTPLVLNLVLYNKEF